MLSKTSRQLILFHMFLHSEVVETTEVTNLVKVSHRTIARDIKDLESAGLIRVVFSKKEKGYVHMDHQCRCPMVAPIFSDNKASNRHLEKLIRLANIMIGLQGHEEEPYWEEEVYGNQQSCSDWYRATFPNVSQRTMQRDFAELNKIGYCIRYNFNDKCYMVDFPTDFEGILR
ncbi:MAG: DeoR family transcriptional regulator [Clostridiaceae bacterium]|nr:DeoR family transcriptional regulator [Clostridiaceae bacterium]